MSKSIVLLVEDDAELREALVDTLAAADSFVAVAAANGDEALRILATQPVDLVCSDVNMPGINGMQLLERIRAKYPGLPVILMTAYGSVEHSVSAMHSGAVDYLVKPFKSDILLEQLAKYIDREQADSDDQPVAREASSRQLLQLASKVAGTDATVMITGESGTGKEVLARYIHSQSDRNSKPFVAINCAAIPEQMLEATLFGYEKGAFTGAHSAREGKFELANGGTLLLDEISEMDLGLQAKLLRVLQEREVERLGSQRTLKLDVRVIATSNRDLRQHVAQGLFREDLFYRLNVFPLQWTALRDRQADIVPIAERLLQSHCRKMGREPARLDGSAEMALTRHSWPGNVRELDNCIQRALVIQDGPVITATNLALEPVSGMSELGQFASPSEQTVSRLLQECDPADDGLLGHDLRQREHDVILNTLKQHRGRRKQTAEVLGISARTLRYKLAKMREQGVDVDALIDA